MKLKYGKFNITNGTNSFVDRVGIYIYMCVWSGVRAASVVGYAKVSQLA